MRCWIRTPFSVDRNLGKVYNEEMEMIPDNDAACFIDGDLCFLTPDYGKILNDYVNAHPESVLICQTNRIHELSKFQNANMPDADIKDCIRHAEYVRNNPYAVTKVPAVGSISGFLLVVPKSVWDKHKFSEVNTYKPGQPNLLGVDNEWTNRIRANGVEILRMEKLFVWHSYRILTGSKAHLQ